MTDKQNDGQKKTNKKTPNFSGSVIVCACDVIEYKIGFQLKKSTLRADNPCSYIWLWSNRKMNKRNPDFSGSVIACTCDVIENKICLAQAHGRFSIKEKYSQGRQTMSLYLIWVKLLMTLWYEAFQCYEIFCHDPNITSSICNWVELGGVLFFKR